VASCCECGDELSGSCATELVSYLVTLVTWLLNSFSCVMYRMFLKSTVNV
jgi:hypothetical protein